MIREDGPDQLVKEAFFPEKSNFADILQCYGRRSIYRTGCWRLVWTKLSDKAK